MKTNHIKTLLICSFLVSLTPIAAQAQLLSYTFAASNNGVPVAPTITDTTTTSATDLNLGSGLTPQPFFGYMATTPNDSTLAAAVADNAYFTLTVSPTAGNALNLTNFDLSGARFANNNGPTTFTLESSVNGFGSTAGMQLGSFSIPATYNQIPNGSNISLSSTDFSNLSTTVEFRLYLFAGSVEDAGFYDAGGIGPINIDGTTVSSVPEPSTWAMMLGGLGLLAFFQRHSRRV